MSNPRIPNTQIIGEAPAFLAMLEQASRAAPLSKPVLVIGERGTGKELIGARLHFLSGRWEQPLVKVNCAALTETLLESELFGHESGAFTGATKRHIGRFERAHEGTLFLDELATVPLRMQEKILRVIEYGDFERVGGSESIAVDVRIVGATNEDLPALARRGRFRRDLLDRLAFDVITVPPLRARREDILTLAEHFAVNVSSELGREYFPGFGDRACEDMLTYAWPGNVRELKNAIERSVYRSDEPDAPIERIDLDPFDSPWRPRSVASDDASEGSVEPGPTATGEAVSGGAHPPAPALPVDLQAEVKAFEIELVGRALDAARYNQKRAARLLGLSYHQLRRLVRKHDVLANRLARRRDAGAPANQQTASQSDNGFQ